MTSGDSRENMACAAPPTVISVSLGASLKVFGPQFLKMGLIAILEGIFRSA